MDCHIQQEFILLSNFDSMNLSVCHLEESSEERFDRLMESLVLLESINSGFLGYNLRHVWWTGMKMNTVLKKKKTTG